MDQIELSNHHPDEKRWGLWASMPDASMSAIMVVCTSEKVGIMGSLRVC